MKLKMRALLFSCLTLLALGFYAVEKGKPYLKERKSPKLSLEKFVLDLEGDGASCAMPDLTSIASEPFHYLGHGDQAVAFLSQDGNYVLKFLLKKSWHGERKFPLPKLTHWISSHRKSKRAKKDQMKMQRVMRTIRNYSLAYQKIPELTGILGLHFFSTKRDLPTVCLYDAKGDKLLVELDRASFILQKKAELIKEHTEDKRAALSQFFSQRTKAGFADRKGSFMVETNYGLIGENLIQLDLGNVEFSEELIASPEKEMARLENLLNHWR